MIAVPFVYFSLLALLQLKKNRGKLDIGFFIASIYAFSGLMSILLYVFDVSDDNSYDISFLSTFVYCGLLSLNMFPFLKYSHLHVTKIIPLSSGRPLKILGWLAFIWFVSSFYLSFDSFIRVLTGDMLALRNAVYSDTSDASWMSALPAPLRFLFALLNMMFGKAWILIMLSFYCMYVQKLGIKYFFFFLLSSLSGPLGGILIADRSATAYWMLALIANYLLFFPMIPSKHKKYLNVLLVIILTGFVVYLSMMTNARFGESDSGGQISGAVGSLIIYLGQSFPNFCYFLENFEPAFLNLNLLFPNIAKYIFGSDLISAVKLQDEMTLKTGVFTGLFYTYLGHIRVFCGVFMMFVFAIVYRLVASSQLKKMHNNFFTLKSLFIYLALSSIMFLGVFVYQYAGPSSTFSILFFLIFISFVSRIRKL